MNIVLLSGGSGQRLWPLSNEIRSKQFIKIFHKEDGELESMVQRVYRQIRTVDTDATVTIATSKSQVSAIHNQLGENVGISVEPCRRDTFPAIALAAAYLKDVQHAVVEHEPLIEVMRFSGTWKDLGTWNTLTEAMDSNNVGEALFNKEDKDYVVKSFARLIEAGVYQKNLFEDLK